MYTSAGALRGVLKSIADKKFSNLSQALASEFGLAGEDAPFIATVRLMKTANSVLSDINEASFDNEGKEALKQSFRSFEKLLSFNTYSHSKEQLNNDLLATAQLNNLYSIDLALDGKVNRIENKEIASAIAQSVVKLRDEILDSNLPDALKSSLSQRLSQLDAAVNHFRIWGPAGLKDCLTMLAGDLLLNLDQQTKDNNSVSISSVIEVIRKATGLVNETAKTMKNGEAIVDNADKIIGTLSDLGDKIG